MIVVVLVFTCVALVFSERTDAVPLDFSGFVKNFLVGQHIPQFHSLPGATDDAPGGETLVANNLRVRATLDAALLPWLDGNAAYNFVPRWQDNGSASLLFLAAEGSRTTYRIDDLDPVLLPRDLSSDDNLVILQNLDRLQLTFAAPLFDFVLGRQAVNWGSARVINPTDVIAPFLFTEIDTENRLGVDAARVRIPTGDLGEVDIGYVAGEQGRFDNSALYARTKLYERNTDMSAIVMQFRQQTMLGLDLTRGIGGAGTWVEFASVWVSDDARASVPPASQDVNPAWYSRASLGADYSLTNGTYLFLEYHWNGSGASSTSDYRFLFDTPAYTDGSVYLLGQHYVTPGFLWPASALWSLSGSTLINVTDGSVMANGIIEYNWTDNLYASLGFFAGIGERPTFDPPPGSTGAIENAYESGAVIYASEFGSYPGTVYGSLRYYY